ncbi:MAG: hypothetical protein CMJ48_15075 [Planctomycetaceae bacterium]|nr:hypothetical protein [Planctomycetaceae bacterium]
MKLDGADPVTVQLQAPGVLRGQVVDAATREPIEQYRVRLGFSRVRQAGDAKGSFSSRLGQPGVTVRSEKGEFLVTPLTAGMPFEVTVEADGYERFVIERAVASKADEVKPLSVSLKRVDATQRSTLTGRILDHAGKPASGAQLRLIVATDQPTGVGDRRFSRSLIETGNLGRKSYCEQFLSAVSDAQGRFEFKNILPGKYLQLAYWGKGVPRGRSLAFDETRPGKMEPAAIKLPEPATIRGTIERSQFPQLGSVQLVRQQGTGASYKITLKDDKTTFAFEDLPPGPYSLFVSAKPVRYSENGNTFFRVSSFARRELSLKPGDTRTVRITEPDVLTP